MSQLQLFLLFIFAFFTSTTLASSYHPCFQQYIEQYKKTYTPDQLKKRQIIYNASISYILKSKCNAFGVNNFTDWTRQEMKDIKGVLQMPQHQLYDFQETTQCNLNNIKRLLQQNNKTPDTYDWRDKNGVSPIRYQAACGACWAFSSTAFIESYLIIEKGVNNNVDLSQQYLISCVNRSLGCGGGYPSWAIQKVIDDGGMPTQKKYPFDYKNPPTPGMCIGDDFVKVSQDMQVQAHFDVKDQQLIKQLILQKPVAINVCAIDFQYYKPTQQNRTLECNPLNMKIDHSVLLIGYTKTQWIIKNSWSTSWGLEGFGYISRTTGLDCCIGQQVFTTANISQSGCSIQNCQMCIQTLPQSRCKKCVNGYYLVNLKSNSSQSKQLYQQKCIPCFVSNCLECQNYYGTCSKCQPGYTLDYPRYRCSLETVKNCQFQYDGKCKDCADGWVLNDKKDICQQL